MRWRSMASRRLISAASSTLGALDLERARFLLGLDALGRDRLLLRDAGGLDRLRGRRCRLPRRRGCGRSPASGRALPGRCADGFASALARRDCRRLQRLVALDLQLRVFCSAAMRSAASVFSRAMRAASTALLRLDLGFLDRAHLLDLQRAGALVGRDALDIDDHGLGDARPFRSPRGRRSRLRRRRGCARSRGGGSPLRWRCGRR